METRVIGSVDDLHRAIRDGWNGHYLYRGENRSDYELRPRYGRYQMQDSRNTPKMEQLLLDEFKRRSAPLIKVLPRDAWEWLAVAQHYGVCTRLLDWTENPLVAAFFAARDLSAGAQRVIYALPRRAVPYASLNESPFDLQEVVLYRPHHIATRITSQYGVFTVHNRPSEVFAPNELARWTFEDIECCVDIRATLETYGIDEASVFADLDGLARKLNADYVRGIIAP